MITLDSLQKIIDQNTVINIEALKVEAGEIAALVGPIDSGKETLLELLTGPTRVRTLLTISDFSTVIQM